MNQETERAARGSLWGWLPGLVVSLLAIWLLLRLVSLEQLAAAFQTINLAVVPLAILFYFLGMLTRAFAWQTLLQRRVSYIRVVFTLNEGYLLNNIFPLRIGELGRAFLLGRSSGLGMLPVLSTIVVERSFDMAIAAGLLLATLPLALQMDWARPVAWIILLLVIGGLVALHLMARFHVQVESFLVRLGSRQRWLGGWLVPKILLLLDGFEVLTNLRLFLISLAAMVVSWGLAITENWILLRGIVPDAPFWWAAFIIGVTSLGIALPSVSGAVGVLEAAVVAALVILKVDPSIALAYAIVLHAIHFFLSSAVGMVGFIRDGESLTNVYRELRFRKGDPRVS